MHKKLTALALLVVLSACTQYSLVDGATQKIGSAYSVNPQIQWSKTTAGKIELWTVDGSGLQAIRFYKGLKDGDALYTPAPGKGKEKLPAFKSDMRASEVMELVVDSLARGGGSEVQSANLRPEKFGSLPGYRFDLSFLSTEGLEMEGTVAGTVVDGTLYLIMYTGATVHYYPKHKGDVDRILSSIEMI